MSEFVQIHMLTTYPPGNPNRDDLGRPKTVAIGGELRQRISSQCLKRTWRTSETFKAFAQGVRTKDVVGSARAQLTKAGVADERAEEVAVAIGAAVGSQAVTKKSKAAKAAKTKSKAPEDDDAGGEKGAVLTFLTAHEVQTIKSIVEAVAKDHDADIEKKLEGLASVTKDGDLRSVSPDVALFGRMVAKKPMLGIDAALQVAHAFTVHPATLDVDYWTGRGDEDEWFDAAKTITEAGAGAGMIDAATFGGGVFYTYACVNLTQLEGNLSGDANAARDVTRALVETMAVTAPSGKKTQFATNVRAGFMMLERGERQPRSLAAAFQTASDKRATLEQAAKRLAEHKDGFDRTYSDEWQTASFLAGGDGSLKEVLESI